MLYNILEFFKIKNKNKFMTMLFFLLSLIIVGFVCVSLILFLLGEGRFGQAFNPFIYALAMLCPVLAFSYGVNSGLLKSKEKKVKWFSITVVSLASIFGIFFITTLNNTIWWLLELAPNYEKVYKEFYELFAPAIKTITLVGPFVAMFHIIDYLLLIPREDDINKGINGFCGLKVSNKKPENRNFMCDNVICIDVDSSKPVVVAEKKRMEATLVQGATGTGKTAMMLLPMSARDLEKKYFIREYSKKLGYSLLKRGIAYIEGPYTNEFINLNFNLNYLKPKKGYEKDFADALSEVLLYKDDTTGEMVFKNVGVTVVENDGKYVDDFTKVAHNFDIEVLTVDPMNPNTMSMNPFAIKDPAKVASIIADVLRSMQQSEGGSQDVFFSQVTSDAFQNLAILLKEMYPLQNNGVLPSLEDLLELLYNFDKVEEMTEDLKKIPELAEKYRLLINYFEKNFYKPSLNINGFEIPGTRGSGRKDTEKFLYGAITQLNNLIRHPGIKKALCGKTNVIDFDAALKNGSIITACSRKGDLGVINSKAFGMFFILQFQDSVLRRPGIEDSRVPHFLYIDEFPEYINKDMEVIFTLFRKYRCGTTIAIQNLSQLEKHKGLEYYRQVVLANTKTQVVFGDTVPEDSEYWNKAFGLAKKVDVSSSFDASTGDMKAKKSIAVKDKERFKTHKISEHGFGAIYYKTKALNGNSVFGEGKVSFLEDKYKQKHAAYMYDFEKFMINKPTSSTDSAVPVNENSILDDNDDYIFNTTIDTKTKEIRNPNPIVENVQNETIKQFDLTDDFEIEIDTGTSEDNN
ncbi:MAG: TraM recognition domain-containing protein [Clostridia bacterium]|nr:TraM recognition domain-containing protein [Clostridia bacterium]